EWDCWVSSRFGPLRFRINPRADRKPMVPPDLMVAVLVVVVPLTWTRQSHDGRAGAEILDRARPDNARVQGPEAHKQVSHRCLEVIDAVEHEGVVGRNRGREKRQHRECGSGASPEPIVQHDGALPEAVDLDPYPPIAQDRAL